MQYPYPSAVAALFLALSFAPARGEPPSDSASTASGPPPSNAVRMDNFGTLASFLNLASGTVRVVAVLSPSSGAATSVLEAVVAALRSNPSRRLRAYVVMSRMSADDTDIRALNYAVLFRDSRLTFLWDPNATAPAAFRNVADSTTEPAAGLCMLYDTDARFAVPPPLPVLWMSANPRIQGPALDAKRLSGQADVLVRRVEARAGEPARSPR